MARPKKIKENDNAAIKKVVVQTGDMLPGMFGEEIRASCYDTGPRTTFKRNRAATIVPQDRFKNIMEGFDPFVEIGGYLNIYDMVLLVNKAYWNFASFRNIVDTKVDLCNQEIELEGGNQKSRDFITAWLNKINISNLQQQYYTECFRSANVFFYNLNGVFSANDLKKIGKTGKDTFIPVKYILLNAQYIRIPRGINYAFPSYYRYYTDYELQKLRNPQSQDEKDFVNSLSPEDREALNSKNLNNLLLKINPNQLTTVFYKKQDYEPFAVPAVQTALDDINWKMELKKIDRAIARTMDWCVLLITMGAAEKDGGYNPLAMAKMQELLGNESVKRTIVADHTTVAKWLVPPVHEILGPAKYQQVNDDIKEALNAVFLDSADKFANAQIKVSVFMKGIQNTQSQFLTEFLQPQINKICKILDFKSVPQAYYVPYDINNDVQFKQIFVKMAQMGALTPKELVTAFESGDLPTPEESLQNQTEFAAQKEKGLYQPVLNAPQQPASGDAGRPTGTKAPQKSKNVAPIGTSKASEALASEQYQFSMKGLYDVINNYMKLKDEVKNAVKKKFKVKNADITQAQQTIIDEMTAAISVSHNMNDWNSSIKTFIDQPTQTSPEVATEIDKLAAHFDIDREYATMLYLSRKNIEENPSE